MEGSFKEIHSVPAIVGGLGEITGHMTSAGKSKGEIIAALSMPSRNKPDSYDLPSLILLESNDPNKKGWNWC